MTKYIGVLILIFSFSMGGFVLSSAKKRRIKELREIIRFLNDISVMLRFSKKPLNQMFCDIYKNGYDSLSFIIDVANSNGAIFDSFVFFAEKSNLCISYEEKQLLYDFIKALGTTDSEGQSELVMLYRQMFSQRLDNVLPECEKQCRLSNSLGVLLGIFVSIILV